MNDSSLITSQGLAPVARRPAPSDSSSGSSPSAPYTIFFASTLRLIYIRIEYN